MALNTRYAWLISYDITEPRRLRRLHRFLRRHATPVQYSVFLFEGTAARMGRLMQQVEDLIDPCHDDVRGYELPAQPELTVLGRSTLPPETALHSATSGVLAALLRGGKA